jgi:hypothetical protein
LYALHFVIDSDPPTSLDAWGVDQGPARDNLHLNTAWPRNRLRCIAPERLCFSKQKMRNFPGWQSGRSAQGWFNALYLWLDNTIPGWRCVQKEKVILNSCDWSAGRCRFRSG